MEASTTAGTIVSSSSVFTSSSRNISTILFTQPSVTGVLTTTPTHMTETTTDTSVGVLTTFAHVTETISDASVEVLTTFAHMTETISDAFVGVLTTTPTHMTETISDASVGFLTTTSADMTETTSDAFLGPRVCNSTMQGAPPSKRNHQDQGALQTVGAANVDDESVRAIVVGVPLALFLAILLALALALVLLCCTSKRKGTYYTNEAECGDSVDSYGGAFQSEKVLLEILNEEE
ncbi:uncharacterized protein LOC129840393 isoform X2 [Salvelinus fontinalis]|uniref:uncharacterized protein LOC129840393 isoform X2 n=1 Tax=Salvelinus fontinalis TaxID=8038 RepID=UPI0024857AD8|nr:uncharacterized protein LOC129840393 isoform X2 [Salvelinus fontinalis]